MFLYFLLTAITSFSVLLQFELISRTMKSFILIILFVLCSQTVRCDTVERLLDVFVDVRKSLPIKNEIIRIFSKCDMLQIQNILARNKHKLCTDQSSISDIKTYFLQCVDSNHVRVIDSIQKVAKNVLNTICGSNREQLIDMIVVWQIQSVSKPQFFKQFFLQTTSCIFGEKEVMEASKSVDTVLEFYGNLIQGNDQQCSVVDRIRKCALNNFLNGTEKKFVDKVAAQINFILKAFDCELNVEIDVSFIFEKD